MNVLRTRDWALLQVMEGMQEGTLFNREVVEAEENASKCTSTAASEDGDSLETVRDLALGARTASRKLAACPTEVSECMPSTHRSGSAIIFQVKQKPSSEMEE